MAKYLPNFRQGDSYRIKIKYPKDTDLTDYEHTFVLLPSLQSGATPTLTISSTFGDDESDLDNVAYINVTSELTTSVPPGQYYYGIKVTNSEDSGVTIIPPVDEYNDKILVAPKVI